MQTFLTISVEPFQLRVVFHDEYQHFAVLENVQAMMVALFPGSTIHVEQVDDLTFVASRG